MDFTTASTSSSATLGGPAFFRTNAAPPPADSSSPGLAREFAELRRVAQWIEQHPHRDEITAYLITRLRSAKEAS
jgi:hypothetical protein